MRPLLFLLLLAGCQGPLLGSPAVEVGPAEVEVFDLFEAHVPAYTPDATLRGRFQRTGDTAVEVDGYRDGELLRLRFMPSKFGEHVFALTLSYGGRRFEQRGTFRGKDARRRGAPRVDRVYPWHFVWEGSGERYLWNGVAGDGLLGLDEATMHKAIDRLGSLGVTRVRLATLDARRLENVIRYARTKDLVVALAVGVDRLRETVARWSAFSNVMWEVADPAAGPTLKTLDPYGRLTCAASGLDARSRRAAWVDVATLPATSGGHGLVLQSRREQEAEGRILPQVVEGMVGNEETLRRWAWGVAMAGGYGAGGEAEKEGLQGRARLMEFLGAAEGWRLSPRDELVRSEAWCLAEAGKRYAVYQPDGRPATLFLEPGRYRVRRFDPRSGTWEARPPIEGSRWTAPEAAGGEDWAWILDRS